MSPSVQPIAGPTDSAGELDKLRLAVGVITRRRPMMLRSLLGSLTRCRTPNACEVFYVVVENDSVGLSEGIVSEYRDLLNAEIIYRREEKQGIPLARNTVVNISSDYGADILAFIDDDEEADQDWLLELVDKYRETNAYLIGGPVVAVASTKNLGFWQKMLFRGLEKRYNRKSKKNAKRYIEKGAHREAVVTNNWLGKMELFRKYGLRFDERLALSGGSDTAFDKAVTELGLEKAWAERAIVRETVPESRLSIRYQFRRSRDQSIVSIRRKLQNGSFAIWLVIPIMIAVRCTGLIFLFMLLPFLGGVVLVDLARSAGWMWGRILGLMGRQSHLYADVTGS